MFMIFIGAGIALNLFALITAFDSFRSNSVDVFDSYLTSLMVLSAGFIIFPVISWISGILLLMAVHNAKIKKAQK